MWMCGDVIIHSGLIYMKIYPNQPRVWRMCVPKAGALGLKIMTAHEYLPLTNSHVPPPECVVTEQSTTCCCFFYRHICHGDGCHPGRLPGASHPCREDGRPLRARRASQTDVEAGGGGAAAAAGLNAESCRWKRCIRLAAGRPAPVTRVRLGLHCSNWFLTNGKKLCRRTEQQQQQQRHNLRGCQACDREAWCKSDKDSDTRKQYLHCDVWRLNNTSYFPCGSCSYRSGAAGLTTGFINVFIPSCLQCFASGQSLTHNENISYPAKDIISPTTVLKGPVHNKLRKHFPLFCCAIYESANKEDLNSSVFPEMMTWLCFLSPSTHRGKHVRHEHESRDTERKLKTAHDKVCGWSLITSSWHL